MNDRELDQLIDKMKPDIRRALRSVITGQQAVDIFTLADGTNSQTGAKSKLVLFVAHEAPAAFLEAALNGWSECNRIYGRLLGLGEATAALKRALGG